MKKTQEEISKERQEKINATLDSFNVQLKQLAKQKVTLLSKLADARRLGLAKQEQQARALLGNCLAQEKRVLGMQMQMELAVQQRDLSNLEQSFLDVVSDMSNEISSNVTKSKIKKSKKKYLKSIYNASQQNDRMDEMLRMGDVALTAEADMGKFNEFDDEIDKMLEEVEGQGQASMSKTRF